MCYLLERQGWGKVRLETNFWGESLADKFKVATLTWLQYTLVAITIFCFVVWASYDIIIHDSMAQLKI